MKFLISLLFLNCLLLTEVPAQFAPQAGVAGTTAISSGSSLFTAWATGCTVQRGYQDIAQPTSGYATSGDSSFATGMADNYVVSLGDSGVAVLTFTSPIYDGNGPDFAVFENGFANPQNDSQAFLELAFVEVSSDGVHYVRFPATSYTQDTAQIPIAGTYMYANLINNLAGKYVAHYGTPFDLHELIDSPDININNITHVRVVDVVGSVGSHASYDMNGNKINDPYPTAIPTGGFDLDAVGVINQLSDAGVQTVNSALAIIAYPNPASDKLIIAVPDAQNDYIAFISDVTGRILINERLKNERSEISLSNFCRGLYYLSVCDKAGNRWVEKITKL